MFAVRYDQAPHPARPPGFGRVARYAWGLDYHGTLKRRLQRVVRRLQRHLGRRFDYRTFTDAVPLLERAYAVRAGLGFIGRNTLLIRPGVGSYLLLAELVSEVEVAEATPAAAHRGCGGCHRCQPACPTEALVEEYQLDARRCISYLTIEKRGALSLQERGWIGEWLFGCDVCQDVCPFNHRAQRREGRADLERLTATRGVGPLLNLAELLQLRDAQMFWERFKGTALRRAGRESLLRNACAVAVNTRAGTLLPDLERAFQEDASPLVRQHALWAVVTLAALDGAVPSQARRCLESARRDPAPEVREEALALLEHLPSL